MKTKALALLFLVVIVCTALLTYLNHSTNEERLAENLANANASPAIAPINAENVKDMATTPPLCLDEIGTLQLTKSDLETIRSEIQSNLSTISQNELVKTKVEQFAALKQLDPLRINQQMFEQLALESADDIATLRADSAKVSSSIVEELISSAKTRDRNTLKESIGQLKIRDNQLLTVHETSLVATLLKKTSIEDFIYIFDGFLEEDYTISVLDLADAIRLMAEMSKIELLVGYSKQIIYTVFNADDINKSMNFITFSLIHMRIDAATFFLENDVNAYTNLNIGGPLDYISIVFIDVTPEYLSFVRAALRKGYRTIKERNSENLKNKLRKLAGSSKNDLLRDEFSFNIELPSTLRQIILNQQVSILNNFLETNVNEDHRDIRKCISGFYARVDAFKKNIEKPVNPMIGIFAAGEKEALEIYSLYLKGTYDEAMTFKLLSELNTIASKMIASKILDTRSEAYYSYLINKREQREVAKAYNTIFWMFQNDDISSATNEIQALPNFTSKEKDDIFVELLITTNKSTELLLDTIVSQNRISENNVIQLIRTNQAEVIDALLNKKIIDVEWRNSSTRNLLWNAIDMKSKRTVELLLDKGVKFDSGVDGDFDALDKALLTASVNSQFKKIALKMVDSGFTLDKSHQQLIEAMRLIDGDFEHKGINQ